MKERRGGIVGSVRTSHADAAYSEAKRGADTMPALHRMPITYVVLLVVGLIALAWPRSAEKDDETATVASTSPADQTPTSSTPQPTPPETAPVPPSAPAPVLDPIKRTVDGLRRKVVVTGLDVVPRPSPDTPGPEGKRLDYLAIRYVYDETPTALRIGDASGPQGWVEKTSVLEWDTRLMALPTPREGRLPLQIYEEEGCLIAKLEAKRCPRHSGDCPIVAEESGNGSNQDTVLGWPVIATRTVTSAAGTPSTVLEVAPLVNAPAPEPTAPPAEMIPSIRTVYIAFVIDTTASMQSTIDSVREVARKLGDDAGKRNPDITLKLGLVAYRDRSPVFEYTAKRVTRFTDPAGFIKALESISAAKKGDGSVDESVLDGVELALPGDAEHLDWPVGPQSNLPTKVLVLLGDAPDHARDLTRAGKLAATANREGITIAAVSIRSTTVLTKSEKSRYEAQWSALADGSYRPRDVKRKFAAPLPSQLLSLDQVSSLATTLSTLIDARFEAARDLARLAAAEAEGRLTDYVNSQGMKVQDVVPVLVDLKRNTGNGQAKTNLKLEGRKAPTVRRGWVALRVGGIDQVSLQMLLGPDELDFLIAELTALQQAVLADDSELAKLVEVGNAAATGETGFMLRDRGNQTFADHLKRRHGVAPTRSDSLLSRSREGLLRADEIDRSALNRGLSESLLKLTKRRGDPDWKTAGKTFEGKALVPFAWIDF